MASGKLNFVITIDTKSFKKVIMQVEENTFLTFFDEFEELESIVNINGIAPKDDE